MFAGIDLGGTKIEASVFGANFDLIETRRVATPVTYGALLDALVDQYEWLCNKVDVRELPLGIGIPGIIDPTTGLSNTSNLPATGMPLHSDLSDRLGFSVPVENDCKCFAMSEANGGAGDAYETVFGLILGTGCGGGVCFQGALVKGRNGLPGEVGHFGIPIDLANSLELPCLRCGCGRSGCYETLISGPGMSALSQHYTGEMLSPKQVVAAAHGGDKKMNHVVTVWTQIVCELVHTIQLTIDPDCIILGGGLSRIEGLVGKLNTRYDAHRIAGVSGPDVIRAKYGDSSGVRGAALLGISNNGLGRTG